jgi:hypothetical protein
VAFLLFGSAQCDHRWRGATLYLGVPVAAFAVGEMMAWAVLATDFATQLASSRWQREGWPGMGRRESLNRSSLLGTVRDGVGLEQRFTKPLLAVRHDGLLCYIWLRHSQAMH